jgi:hypothetical protein
MTAVPPEPVGLPDGLALDGELVVFGDDGLPSSRCALVLEGRGERAARTLPAALAPVLKVNTVFEIPVELKAAMARA